MDVVLFFEYLEQFDFPGAGMFQYVTFRSAMAALLALFISIFAGKFIIRWLQKNRLGKPSVILIWKGNTVNKEHRQWEE